VPLTYTIDPWASEYESALQMSEEPDDDDARISVRIDTETDDWQLLEPSADLPLPSPVAFIDGVQRVELRVLTEHEGKQVYGAFASVGVGAVFADGGAPDIASERPRRTLALSSGVSDESRSVPCGELILTFEAHSDPKDGYPGVREALDGYRREWETRLGRSMVERGERRLVIVDGRLRFGGLAVGLTKTLHRQYLPSPQSGSLRELRPGTRTPLFEIAYKEPLYSWYTRLAEPGPIDHALAAVVRLETMASIGKGKAIELADMTTAHLPRFASSPIWDARAPQNLYPFAALEARLRHELGEPAWIRRAIEAYIMGGGP
jgi:hypothetical protein